MKNEITVSTCHEYILEAIASIRFGLTFHEERDKHEPSGANTYGLLGDMYGRYAFIMIANSLEAAANAMLLHLKVDNYEKLERMKTSAKFTTFCNTHNCTLDLGDVRFQRVNDIITCRNQFVHPKPRFVEYTTDVKGNEVFAVQRTGQRSYPFYHSLISLADAVQALQDTLAFLSWMVFDICEFPIQEGAFVLGFNSYGSTADIDFVAAITKIKFDERTFGTQ